MDYLDKVILIVTALALAVMIVLSLTAVLPLVNQAWQWVLGMDEKS